MFSVKLRCSGSLSSLALSWLAVLLALVCTLLAKVSKYEKQQ